MRSVEILVIGAGIAGLTAAGALQRAGRDVLVVDAGDAVGGRARTDVVDGLVLDRGFQLLNPAYPAAKRLLDLDALELCQFGAGVVAAHGGGRRSLLADPRRERQAMLHAVRAVLPTTARDLRSLWHATGYLGSIAFRDPESLREREDIGWRDALDGAGVQGVVRDALEVFLAGVLAEEDGTTSRRFVDLIINTFAAGVPGLPHGGMQRMAEQLASHLSPERLELDREVVSLDGTVARTHDDEISAAAVVVATGGSAAADLLGQARPAMHGLTTYYHHLEHSPAHQPMLHVDLDRAGPVVNTAVVSDAAPTYASHGALVQTTVLGAHDDAETLAAATAHAGRIYGVGTAGWRHVATYAIPEALPAMPAPLDMRREQRVRPCVYVAGDHRDTSSLQGAMVSGERVAERIAADLPA